MAIERVAIQKVVYRGDIIACEKDGKRKSASADRRRDFARVTIHIDGEQLRTLCAPSLVMLFQRT